MDLIQSLINLWPHKTIQAFCVHCKAQTTWSLIRNVGGVQTYRCSCGAIQTASNH